MSKFVVNLDEPQRATDSPPIFSAAAAPPKKRRGCLKILAVLGILTVFILLIGAVGSYLYWQSVKRTPQYSLALLVDAARRNDKETVSQIIDTEQVVNNFIPQISDKAVELYGRNIPPPIIAKMMQLITPFIPAIKDKAKDELPQMIREKTEKFSNVPYWMIALFADRGLEIKIDGENAQVKSKVPDRPLELTMKRDGERWKVVGIKDEKLAHKVAEKVGQQLIALVAKGNLRDAEKQLKVENLGNIVKELNNMFK